MGDGAESKAFSAAERLGASEPVVSGGRTGFEIPPPRRLLLEAFFLLFHILRTKKDQILVENDEINKNFSAKFLVRNGTGES